MEIIEFCTSGFTAQCAVYIYGIYGACLKWMLPELSFSDRWSRGTKLWEQDCVVNDKPLFAALKIPRRKWCVSLSDAPDAIGLKIGQFSNMGRKSRT